MLKGDSKEGQIDLVADKRGKPRHEGTFRLVLWGYSSLVVPAGYGPGKGKLDMKHPFEASQHCRCFHWVADPHLAVLALFFHQAVVHNGNMFGLYSPQLKFKAVPLHTGLSNVHRVGQIAAVEDKHQSLKQVPILEDLFQEIPAHAVFEGGFAKLAHNVFGSVHDLLPYS